MFGQPVVDGLNALPLARDLGGRRAAKVEADLLLFGRVGDVYHGWIGEVKHSANDPWHAVVQSLLQLTLARRSGWLTEYCAARAGPLAAPLAGVVIAPETFYTAPGRRQSCMGAVHTLLDSLATGGEPPVTLTTWRGERLALERYSGR